MSKIIWTSTGEPVQVSVNLDREMNVFTCDKCGRAFAVENPTAENYECPACLRERATSAEQTRTHGLTLRRRLETKIKRLEREIRKERGTA